MAALAAAVALRRPLRRLEVMGPSMLPALAPGDRVLAVRARRPGRHPAVRPGDLAVVADQREPSRLVVKRVVAVDGDVVTLLGDNAGASTDSRQYGPVPAAAVWGRAVYRYFPPAQRGRIGRLVP